MMRGVFRVAAFAFVAGPAMAWDTLVVEPIGWQSIYQLAQQEESAGKDLSEASAQKSRPHAISIAEHSRISHMTFERLDPSGQLAGMFGRGGSAQMTVIDLNATHFRHDTLYGVDTYGDNPETKVEERLIPQPAKFSGIPDYSYAPYDWLNKNTTCPAFNGSQYVPRCHEFLGWLGALNSVHFGSQAQAMYAHHHRNALELAGRARTLRDSMTEAERDDYREMLLEAELEALAYEGYAQHFLQDRWAIGHMWERWDAPDPAQMPADLYSHIAIGALAGLIHGSEALVRDHPVLENFIMRADPMSSPLPGEEGEPAQPMQFRHTSLPADAPPLNAVGDERLQNAVDGYFSTPDYYDGRSPQRMNVIEQVQSLFDCAGAGWAEVIRAFGPGDGAGTYGEHGAPLGPEAPTFQVLARTTCWDMWATNQSMVTGLLGPYPARSIALMSVLDFESPSTAANVSATLEISTGSRTDLVAHATRMWLYARSSRDGTEIAEGRMTSLAGSLSSLTGGLVGSDPNDMWGFRSGRHYSLPSYVEPIGLPSDSTPGIGNPLPQQDLRGRDVHTLFGAFNRAHSDYWCHDRSILDEVRENFHGPNNEVCQYVADMIYAGTHPSYDGEQSRLRRLGDRETRSVCEIRDTLGVEDRTDDDHGNPFWLDQGYTPREGQTGFAMNFTRFPEVANWCARVPIVELSKEPDLRAENVVMEIDEDESRITLTGLDFGDRQGKIAAIPEGAQRINLTDIFSWTDTAIEIDVAKVNWEAGRDYMLEVMAMPVSGVWPATTSVGLFRLRVREAEAAPQQFVQLDLNGAGPCGDPVRDFSFLDLEASLPPSPNGDQLRKLNERFRSDLAPIKAYLKEQLSCMRRLRDERQPQIEQYARDWRSIFFPTRGNLQASFYFLPFTEAVMTQDVMITMSTMGPSGYATRFNPYTPFILDVEAALRRIDQAETVLDIWSYAYNTADPFLMPLEPIRSGVAPQQELTRDEIIGRYMVDANQDPRYKPSLAVPQTRFALNLVRWETARYDLAAYGRDVSYLLGSVLPGLAPWTQYQHTLSEVLYPLMESHRATLRAAATARFNALAADYPDCVAGIGDRFVCDISNKIVLDDVDDPLVATDRWWRTIFDAWPPFHMGINYGYVAPNGEDRLFLTWPDDSVADRARTRPPGVQ